MKLCVVVDRFVKLQFLIREGKKTVYPIDLLIWRRRNL